MAIQDDHDTTAAPALEKIEQALATLRYGSVTIVVHDGVIVQVDRTEKLRLTRRASRG